MRYQPLMAPGLVAFNLFSSSTFGTFGVLRYDDLNFGGLQMGRVPATFVGGSRVSRSQRDVRPQTGRIPGTFHRQ